MTSFQKALASLIKLLSLSSGRDKVLINIILDMPSDPIFLQIPINKILGPIPTINIRTKQYYLKKAKKLIINGCHGNDP